MCNVIYLDREVDARAAANEILRHAKVRKIEIGENICFVGGDDFYLVCRGPDGLEIAEGDSKYLDIVTSCEWVVEANSREPNKYVRYKNGTTRYLGDEMLEASGKYMTTYDDRNGLNNRIINLVKRDHSQGTLRTRELKKIVDDAIFQARTVHLPSGIITTLTRKQDTELSAEPLRPKIPLRGSVQGEY